MKRERTLIVSAFLVWIALTVLVWLAVRADAHSHCTVSWFDSPAGADTAAHKTLPKGTRIEVAYEGRSTSVVVRDRGPYIAGRELDLDRRAFSQIAPTSAGVIEADCRLEKGTGVQAREEPRPDAPRSLPVTGDGSTP